MSHDLRSRVLVFLADDDAAAVAVRWAAFSLAVAIAVIVGVLLA
jgi:hypothetical protein